MSVPPPLPAHDPYAAPTAVVADPVQGEIVLADRGVRLVAAIVDGLIYFALLMAVAVLLPMAVEGGGGGGETIAMVVGAAATLGFIAVAVVNILWLHRYGQTIGKRLLGIRIVRGDGSHCSVLRVIFARWLPVGLLGAIPLLGYIVTLVDPLMIFRSDYRCLHDLIADTLVVKA
jgi:uncharacterized RDD family membrane protein YckC